MYHHAPVIVNRVYQLEELLGKGEFGSVYKGRHIKNNRIVAIKMEHMHNEIKTIKHETTILNHLYSSGCRSIPAIYWYGIHEDKYTCLVMQHYLCSLHDYSTRKNMPSHVLGEIMTNCIRILNEIHDAWVIHRDIKPQNFMIGEDKRIYMIDFGMATFYVDENRVPIHTTELRDYIIGSPKYASYYVHCGIQSQRRDDLISLGYMYIFLRHKGISWDDFRCPPYNSTMIDRNAGEMHVMHRMNVERKLKKQLQTLIDEIQKLSYNEDSVAITKYMEYCYRLSPTATPNYQALISLFSCS